MKQLPALMLCSVFSPALLAQDLRHLEPEPLPPLAPPSQSAPAPAKPPASGPVLPSLSGLVFLSDLGQMGSEARLENGLDTSRVPFLNNDAFAHHMANWWSQPISERSVQDLLTAVNAYYVEMDRPFVSVIAPSQDISAGVLRVLVVEGQLSEVRTRGSQWFDEAYYRRSLGLPMNEPIQMSQLQAGLDWIARSNPFHNATVLAMPGEEFGSTALELQISERKPLRLYGGANNSGTDTTDRERLVFGANWGRAFGTSHQLNTQLSASPDFHKSVGVSGNYRIPLQSWRHIVQLSAAWSRINADVPAAFDSQGESWQFLINYELPLSIQANARQFLRVGLEFKRSDNNLEFGGMPVTDNTTDVMQLALDWQRESADAWGQTSLNARLVHSPGDMSSRNEDDAFYDSRWGASADYSYGRLDLQRYTRLPAGFSWQLSAAWQQSSDNLLGSEQLGLSGSYGVRGYRENDIYADEGLLVRNELLLPAMSLALQDFYDGSTQDHLQLLLFADYGRGNSKRRLPGEPNHISISSFGVGARYTLSRYLSASVEYGRQQKALPGQDKESRAHLALMLTY